MSEGEGQVESDGAERNEIKKDIAEAEVDVGLYESRWFGRYWSLG